MRCGSWIGIVLGLLVAAPRIASADLRVVATVPDLAALAREIGGPRAQVVSLSLPTQDPHFVDARPTLALQLNKADLLLAIGLSLEAGWLPVLQVGARNPKIQTGGAGYLECAGAVRLLEVPTGPVDRSMGDIHPGGNPHYLHDPRAAEQCAAAIARKLAQLDPAGAAVFDANLRRFATALRARRAQWERRLAPFRGQRVVTYHRSWIYLLDWLGLKQSATLEPKPGIPPSPTHVAHVLGIVRSQNVRVILQETHYPAQIAQLVAQRAGARLVALPSGTDIQRRESYIQHIERIVTALEKAFAGARAAAGTVPAAAMAHP